VSGTTDISCHLLRRLDGGLACDQDGGYARRVSDTVQAQLHVTTWPEIPLPLPLLYRVPSRLDPDSGVIVPCPEGRYGEDWIEEPVELDGETYLRLAAVDLDDPQAILAFVQEYSVLGGWELYVAVTDMAYRIANLFRPRLDFEGENARKRYALAADHARTGSGDAWPTEVYREHFAETLEEFRFAARLLIDLTTAWRMYKEGAPAGEIDWLSPVTSDEELIGEFPEVLLTRVLREAFLEPFIPYLMFRWEPHVPSERLFDHPPGEHPVKVDPKRRPVTNRLYPILALELFNHIVENADYRLCANERCQQRVFVRRQGSKGQHRSKGVRFCSYDCAHATAQRQYRRQLKAKATTECSSAR
jgi:hypothetical protein